MTYLELILLLDELQEKVVSDRPLSIQTDKHIYSKMPDGNWEQRELVVIDQPLTLAPEEPPKEKKR